MSAAVACALTVLFLSSKRSGIYNVRHSMLAGQLIFSHSSEFLYSENFFYNGIFPQIVNEFPSSTLPARNITDVFTVAPTPHNLLVMIILIIVTIILWTNAGSKPTSSLPSHTANSNGVTEYLRITGLSTSFPRSPIPFDGKFGKSSATSISQALLMFSRSSLHTVFLKEEFTRLKSLQISLWRR